MISMKHLLPAAFVLSLALPVSILAADKTPKPPPATPSTLPPVSPKLAVSPPDAASEATQSDKLITSEMSGRDLEFFMKALEAGREQAVFVDLLKKSASSDRVKKLADELAVQKGLRASLEPTAEDKKAAEEIEKLSGSNLDKAALDKVIAASNQALAAYEDAAQSSDRKIKSFAAQMLPLAEEKRHIVEKMTGAGSKTASQLFRHGGVSEGVEAATPAATPSGKKTSAPAAKSTPVATPKPVPAPSGNATPSAATPIALPTPPGVGRAPTLPAIVPPKAPPTPVPVK
jgi:hypothetical protein